MAEAPAVAEITHSEIDETTKLPLRLVIKLVASAVVGAGLYFGLQAQIAAANTRIDGLDAKVAHVERLACALAKEKALDDIECKRLTP